MSEELKSSVLRLKFAITPFVVAMGFFGLFKIFTDNSFQNQIIFSLSVFLLVTYISLTVEFYKIEKRFSILDTDKRELNDKILELNQDKLDLASSFGYTSIRATTVQNGQNLLVLEQRNWIKESQILAVYEKEEDTTEPVCIIKIISFTHVINAPGFPVGKVIRQNSPTKVSEMFNMALQADKYTVTSSIRSDDNGVLR